VGEEDAQRLLQPEIRSANGTRWFAPEAARRSSATLCLPACRRERSEPPTFPPPLASACPGCGVRGCRPQHRLPLPVCPARPQRSVRPSVRAQDRARRGLTWQARRGREMLSLPGDFAPGWPGHRARGRQQCAAPQSPQTTFGASLRAQNRP